MRPFRFISWALAVAIVAYSIATYGSLPDAIPTQLSFNMSADAFAPRSPWRWALMPAIATGLLLLFELLARMMPANPGSINIADKERFLRLPRAYQAAAILEVQRMLDLAAVGVLALFFGLQWKIVNVAMGAQSAGSGSGIAMMIAPFALTMVLLLMVTRVTAAVDREERRWKDAGSPPA